jgi:hypothetical protein
MRLCFVLFLGILAPMMNGACETPGPSIYIENPSRDVGTIIQGETISQVFIIANKGSRTLEISNVTHS